jgi:hypothetical protein
VQKIIITVLLLVLPHLVFAGSLPDTGQTKCYDDRYEITCPEPGEPFYGQDAQYIINPQSYTKLDENGNPLPDDAPWPWAMVRDNVTGMIWAMKTDDGSLLDKDNVYTWYEAGHNFIEATNTDTWGGYSDWRLPTVKELTSIINRDRPYVAVNTLFFSYNALNYYYYWVSTVQSGYPSAAWRVSLDDGSLGLTHKSSLSHFCALAVRAGEGESSGNFIEKGNGTITDDRTGLVWQRATPAKMYTWEEALTYCNKLILAGYNDWRLPDVNELQSIADYDRHDPSIDSIFSGTVPSNYWTSTTNPNNPSSAWNVSFSNGMVYSENKSDFQQVRAVRGGGESEPLCPLELIYGKYSMQTQRLRYVRNNISKTTAGQEFIQLYYLWSPAIVKIMEEDESFQQDVKEIIDEVLALIE